MENRLSVLLALLISILLPMNAYAGDKTEREAIAVSFTEKLVAGKVDDCEAMFDATMKTAAPAPKLKAMWDEVQKRVGAYKEHLAPFSESRGGAFVVYVPVVLGSETMDFNIAFASSNEIAGFFVAPHIAKYKEPSYADSNAYTDVQTKVGEGVWQLDGILSVPKGNGPFPALILVHGSGANDQDETLGQNKPFRDLAHGLASKGILVLRYNKRSHQHEKQILATGIKKLTVKEEVLDDVMAATQVVRSRSDVDKQNIFILGHSFGGSLLPRFAAQDPEIKGFISFAGSNVPLEDAIIAQMEYIHIVQPAMPVEQKIIDAAKKIKALQDKDADSDLALLGASATYWLDLRRHNPLDEVKTVDKPMLFLQGGRDYQVTTDGDFANWKQALYKHTRASFKEYPDLNHFFMTGVGKATPQEYLMKTGNVSEQVVRDIAEWIFNCCKPAK